MSRKKKNQNRTFKFTVRGNIMLETILALLFVVLTVGTVASVFVNSLSKVKQSELRTRAMFLAENKLAELQGGMKDLTEGDEGDFNNKPAKYTWKIDLEPIQMQAQTASQNQTQELKRLKISIHYDDPADGFTYTIYRLYSPDLNLSAEKIKEIASDPVKMQAMGGSSEGMQKLMSMLAELPFGDKISEALTRGGVPAMLGLFNKVVGGNISEEDLMAMLGTDGKESQSIGAQMVKADKSEKGLDCWTDYDTAGTGDIPDEGTQLASADKSDKNKGDKDNDQTRDPNQPNTGEGRADRGRGTEQDPNQTETENEGQKNPRSMSRDEATQMMLKMLRKLANQSNKK